MARATKKRVKWKPDLWPLIEMMGVEEFLRQLDLNKLDAASLEKLVRALPLTPEQFADIKRRQSEKGGLTDGLDVQGRTLGRKPDFVELPPWQ